MELYTFCFILTVVPVLSYNSSRYRGYKVYQVIPKNLSQALILKDLQDSNDLDFWNEVHSVDIPVDILVSPFGQNNFESILSNENMKYSITADNVEETLIAETRSSTVTKGNVTFTNFMRHDEINAYLEQLAILYPQTVSIESIGRSFEGRNLILMRISSGGSHKPTIYIEAAIHAREWIAPPVALYIINELVENPENSYLYENIDWAIIPVVNPDGYEYTHTTERFWRKTRSPGAVCHGTDANRNFDALWGADGASNWQCTNTYRGHKVFGEVETRSIRDYILRHRDDIKLFLDVHSYGRWLLYPYGYKDQDADNLEELKTLGGLFNDAVYNVNGQNYTVTSFADGLYYASGTSVDWVKDIGIDLAYTLELPAGGTGFDPPASDILPVVQETWEGFKAFHSYIEAKFVIKLN